MASRRDGEEHPLRDLAIRHTIWVAGLVFAGPYLAVWAWLYNRPWPTSSWVWRTLLIADLVAVVVFGVCYARWKRRQRSSLGARRPTRASRRGTWPLATVGTMSAVLLGGTAVVSFTYEELDSCHTPVRGAALEVMVIWKGDELAAFCDVAELYGHVEVHSVDVRMADALDDAFAHGNPPDVAIVPQPSLVKNYAGEGLLCPIGNDVNERVPDIWRHFTDEDIGNSGAEAPYGAVVKGTLKSMFWYDLDALEGRGRPVPDWTLDDLKAFTREWATEQLGRGSSAEAALRIPIGDRWPLTDLFELLLASGNRRDVYVEMLQGRADWSDPEVIDAVDGALYDIGELLAPPGVVDTETEELSDLRWERSVEVVDGKAPVLVFGPSFLTGPVLRIFGSDVLWPAAFPAAEQEQRPFVVAADFAVLPRPANDCGSGPGQQFVDFLTDREAIRLWSDRDAGFLTPNDASPFVREDPSGSAVPAHPSLDDVRFVVTQLLRKPPSPPEGQHSQDEPLVFDLSDDQLARVDPGVTWQIMRDFYDEVAGTGATRDDLKCPVQRARQRLAAEYENRAASDLDC